MDIVLQQFEDAVLIFTYRLLGLHFTTCFVFQVFTMGRNGKRKKHVQSHTTGQETAVVTS